MKRGRQSAAELSVVVALPTRRPPPPRELTKAQATEWSEIVRALPSDWFRCEQYPLLVAYCRHVCNARFIAKKIEKAWTGASADGFKELNRLLAMEAGETKAILSIARSLRLTHQARYRPETAATKAGNPRGKKPWER